MPFVKADLLMPLDDFIKKAPGLKSDFLPSVFNPAVLEGESYGVPMRGTQPVLLFNNKKVLADAGITPPKTWDDLLAAVKTLKSEGITPIAPGGDQWPNAGVVRVRLRPRCQTGPVREGTQGRQERLERCRQPRRR